MTATSTYDWIKHMPASLFHKDEIPIIGNSPTFPWTSFAERLGKFFSIPKFSIQPSPTFEWRSPEDLLKGFGANPAVLYVTLEPSLAPVSWVISSQDVQQLMSILLNLPQESVEGLDSQTRDEFFQFVAIETLNSIVQIDFDKTLSPRILEKGEPPHEPALCQDVAITISDKILQGRLIMPSDFRHGWKERYAQRKLDVPKQIMEHLEVTVHLEAGRTKLKPSTWAKIQLGDFLLLDSCSLKTEGEGRVMLTVCDMPLFRGKIKDGNIKILEHPLYHEGETAMGTDNSIDEEHFPKEDEESFFDGEDEESEEHQDEESSEEEHGDEDDAEHLDETTETEETETEEETEGTEEAAEDEVSQSESEEAVKVPNIVQKPSKIEEIPFSIVVEVGRLQMSMQKLTELQPGNILDLNVRPENGVDLVVNGKCIAKGELLLLGEALGVRILDLG